MFSAVPKLCEPLTAPLMYTVMTVPVYVTATCIHELTQELHGVKKSLPWPTKPVPRVVVNM